MVIAADGSRGCRLIMALTPMIFIFARPQEAIERHLRYAIPIY